MALEACPAEEQLWPLALGEEAPAAVRSHVASCAACQARTETLRREVAAVRDVARQSTLLKAAPAGRRVPAEAPRVPKRIGPYRVVGLVADEGDVVGCRAISKSQADEVMIWVATHAVEFTETMRERADGLRRKLVALVHPNLPRVFDLGVHDGRPLLAHEFISAARLDDYLRQRTGPQQEKARLLAEVSSAVAAAHAAGIAHGRLSPSCIFVRDDGAALLAHLGVLLLSDLAAGRETDLAAAMADDVRALAEMGRG
jgi:serine/threonine protein kinase